MDTMHTDNADELAAIMRALADPVRIRILRLVADAGELTCSPLAEALDLPQSTLSRHLRVLRESGLAYSRPDGAHRWVGVNADAVNARHPGLLASLLALG
ncbi:helix-turn-helix transcriptional regulator [Calidifontibacter sp. DB0510]|uniref:Helix-turn-helix transcriptional regulator n=1 Tax=Metallococcus carri TaxID=1656884 RepID=A0A967E9M7_9MICO|nr:metalloregulator ArsR/SmtB family transcription factor [Metallococcus carri]NHN55380.1 helix-turn-helix transcriptional regulator [Metallococcus carri]NOP36457.1 helix-turn-helix transcriptional regulator [Calidifontibacter sp. DB2511S]